MSTSDTKLTELEQHELPFAAPCKTLATDAPLSWLKLGWQDLRRAPRQSLTYGTVMLLLSYVVSFIAWRFGNFYSLLTMLSGFVFMGPALAIGLYSISCQLQKGQTPVLGYCLREGKRHFGNALLFAMILMVVFLIWARAASMVHVFFPVRTEAGWQDYALFLGIGSAIGSIFCAIIFSAAAFSLPMIMDRKVDMVTAAVTSINAVLHNKKAMAVWAGLILLSLLISFATALLGLVILLPLIGHATWHGYQETIDASAWPEHD
ncbi:MAG: DUF2189 domain-containing protein [Gammaproteobacteria bacterium]|nr:DUF2189 domain-containing protein [Gammaproteobacteria bacterium]MDH5653510.1 DUF2189 domain-containing protein [Gammaproteobacteria bacterium]